MNDVIRATVKQHNKQPGKIEWRVLVRHKKVVKNEAALYRTLYDVRSPFSKKEVILTCLPYLATYTAISFCRLSTYVHNLLIFLICLINLPDLSLGCGRPEHEDGVCLHQNARAFRRGHHE